MIFIDLCLSHTCCWSQSRIILSIHSTETIMVSGPSLSIASQVYTTYLHLQHHKQRIRFLCEEVTLQHSLINSRDHTLLSWPKLTSSRQNFLSSSTMITSLTCDLTPNYHNTVGERMISQNNWDYDTRLWWSVCNTRVTLTIKYL